VERHDSGSAVQDDLDGVVSAALDAAQHLLAKNGEFFPFGITVSDSGDIGLTATDPESVITPRHSPCWIPFTRARPAIVSLIERSGSLLMSRPAAATP
jgi:hypothetical protein